MVILIGISILPVRRNLHRSIKSGNTKETSVYPSPLYGVIEKNSSKKNLSKKNIKELDVKKKRSNKYRDPIRSNKKEHMGQSKLKRQIKVQIKVKSTKGCQAKKPISLKGKRTLLIEDVSKPDRNPLTNFIHPSSQTLFFFQDPALYTLFLYMLYILSLSNVLRYFPFC